MRILSRKMCIKAYNGCSNTGPIPCETATAQREATKYVNDPRIVWCENVNETQHGLERNQMIPVSTGEMVLHH